GMVRQVDRPQALYDRPADRFVAGFLGWPPMNLLDGELVEEDGQLIFGNRDVRLVASSRPDWRTFTGRPLTLGLRPEDMGLTKGSEEGRLHMEVRLVERLGPVRLVTLAAASWVATARLAPTPVVNEGETVSATFDLTRAHLFDPATGRALCHGLVG